jgi:pimeloyl-ACP methyl ester carboxylesterase
VDYWFGAGRWDAMREEARAPVRAGMSRAGVRWRALLEDRAPLAELQRIDVPTLFLMAENSRPPARAVSELLIRALPHARSVEIGGVGHMAPLFDAERVNPLIESFLADQNSTPEAKGRWRA